MQAFEETLMLILNYFLVRCCLNQTSFSNAVMPSTP